jgi:hypothetical protein
VPHPKGFHYDVALVTFEIFGKVFCIDPIGGDPRNGQSGRSRGSGRSSHD